MSGTDLAIAITSLGLIILGIAWEGRLPECPACGEIIHSRHSASNTWCAYCTREVQR